MLKNYKALSHSRNSAVGHFSHDNRIISAMYNFTHKPVSPDSTDAVEIANRINERIKNKNYPMICLLKKQMKSSNSEVVALKSITDFPRISKKVLKRKIFLGSYQLRMARSYLSELIKKGVAFRQKDAFIKSLKKPEEKKLFNEIIRKKSKLLGFEIPSRHKNGEEYKTWISYTPDLQRSSAINGNI